MIEKTTQTLPFLEVFAFLVLTDHVLPLDAGVDSLLRIKKEKLQLRNQSQTSLVVRNLTNTSSKNGGFPA